MVSIETFTQRIAAAAQAREKINSDIVIIARTDALKTVDGDDFEEAVQRLKAAVAAGADVAFLEGISSRLLSSDRNANDYRSQIDG